MFRMFTPVNPKLKDFGSVWFACWDGGNSKRWLLALPRTALHQLKPAVERGHRGADRAQAKFAVLVSVAGAGGLAFNVVAVFMPKFLQFRIQLHQHVMGAFREIAHAELRS